jgi:hypothetical protein
VPVERIDHHEAFITIVVFVVVVVFVFIVVIVFVIVVGVLKGIGDLVVKDDGQCLTKARIELVFVSLERLCDSIEGIINGGVRGTSAGLHRLKVRLEGRS